MQKQQIFVIFIFFFILMSIMGVGFYLLWNKVHPPDPQIKKEIEIVADDEKKPEVFRPQFPLETFIINLADKGSSRYLRITIVLELTDRDALPEVHKRLAQIRNTILMILPGKKEKEINFIEGRLKLSEEISRNLNALLIDGNVTNVYFTEFIIQ